jgi:Cu(I)/Ag(I) efflux system membrane protein CusA/SilA
MSVGGKTIVSNNSEYLIRGVGWLQGVKDLENVVVTSRAGVPILLKNIASVQLGPEYRRSALEKNGAEAVGGVVMMRFGQNPLEVTQLIKEKIREMQSGLPQGVRIVPFYDRTRLIESAIHTVTGTLREEIIIASIAILLILTHFRSAFVVCITLPLAALISFLFMYYLDIPSNIMSLSGIAISIGILVDAAVVMVENATHELKDHFDAQVAAPSPGTPREGLGEGPAWKRGRGEEGKRGQRHARVAGDTTEIVVRACRLVGRPIFFSVVIMLISFLPVFAFSGQEGKLSHPLAFTKSFAMIGVAILAITLVPAMLPIFIRGRLRGEEENWIVRSFINIYKPLLSWVIDRPGFVWWLMAVILSLGAGFIESNFVASLVLAMGMIFVLLGVKTFPMRITAAITLCAIAFFADTRFRKLGGEFMPSLNEGSILDMPTSAPRIAMAQAIDDVMVRDRLIRSFPEVEQAVGKIGRAETATDPSPIDMVETVITLQPREYWPKRMIHFDDAKSQAQVVAHAMADKGWLKLKDGKLSEDVLSTATMTAIEKFDRAMRELARRRQMEYEPVVARDLVQVAVDMFRTKNNLRAELAPEVGLEHGSRLAYLPTQEEVDLLLLAIKKDAVARGTVTQRDDLLIDQPNPLRDTSDFIRKALGGNPPGFSERVFAAIEKKRDELWTQRTKILNWELADQAPAMFDDFLIDNLLKSAAGTVYAGSQPQAEARGTLRASLDEPFKKSLFLWTKSKDDILKEMDSELQMPGWGNAWTQPIINRVNMLATGVRTQIGVKVFGPSNKPLNEAIDDVQKISNEIAQKLKGVRGAVDVVPDQAVGKRYLEIYIDREKAARYGVNMSEISEAIETAMGGQKITQTVEGRQRFPVRLRYAREYWQDADRIGDVLVTARTSPAQLLETQTNSSAPLAAAAPKPAEMGPAKPQAGGAMGGSGSSNAPSPMVQESNTIMQIPLRMVADIRVVEGPSMIKSENGRLRNYVTLNVRDRDIVGFVDEARQAVKPIEATLAGTGMSIEWSGEFEHQVRARQTMAVIFPMVIVLILFLLYVTFHEMLDTLLVLLAVMGALAGAVMFQAIFGFNFSVIVSIGYVAAFGMATETGVIMLVYLREAIDRRGGLGAIKSLDELREAVIKGAVHRLRPKLLTEGVAIVGLVPMLWASGTGAEIMRPMAAPVLGGLLISDEVIDLMLPVLFYWIRRRRWVKLRQTEPNEQSPERMEIAAAV